MATSRGTEVGRSDMAGFLRALADRLRVHGQALQGMAAVEGDADCAEARMKSQMACDLDLAAACLDLLRQYLCPACRLIEVIERVSIEGGDRENDRKKPARRRSAWKRST